jgi:5-methylcytosine-specific restriction endonuclease McrA
MYYCEFPCCEYQTENRFQINFHHIIPIECGGKNNNYNRIWLCPSCHTSVYVPESKRGIHSIKTENSIIILRWSQSTEGKILEYIDINGELKYYKRK